MKNNFIIIILCFWVVTACKQQSTTTTSTATSNPTSNSAVTDASIEPYVQAFEAKYSSVVSLPVYFDTSSATGGNSSAGTTVGVCRVYSNNYREILVNKTWWDSNSTTNRRILVFHELGHCVFNRQHDFELDSNGNKICLTYDSSNTCTVYKYRTEASNSNRPVSMMYPTINNISTYYLANQTYYEYELQNEKPQTYQATQLTAWQTAYNNYIANNTALADNSFVSSSSNAYMQESLSDDGNIIPYESDFDKMADAPEETKEGCVQHINIGQ